MEEQKYIITVAHYFDAAHKLEDSEFLATKECARLHGHTYAVKAQVSSRGLKGGMAIDFKLVKQAIDVLDHRYINDVFSELGIHDLPTAENIAKFLYKEIDKLDNIKCEIISVCEGFKGMDRASWVKYYES